MRRAQSLSRAAARLTQPCERMSPVVLAEVVGRQDAGVHASAIGAPSARFVEQRAIVGQAGFFQRSFASSSLEGPFRGTPVLLTSSDIAASSAARAADDGEDDDESEEDDNDSSQALMDIPRLESMSRKKQQFLLNQLLRGRASKSTAVEPDRTLDMHVVDVNRTVKVTKGGSLMRFTALVVVGNGNGVVGWGKGKAPEVGSAVDKAYWRAARSLFFFERFEDHTIFHPSFGKFGKTKVEISPLPSGYGVRANTTVRNVCELIGVKDLRAKVHGSHNPHTTIRALFEAFDAIRSPEEVALERGREVIRVNPGADFMTHARFPAGRTVLFT